MQMQAIVHQLSKLVDGDIEVVRNPVMDASAANGTLLGPSHEGAATFQKVVLAHATVFLGNMVSTFSKDVERLRLGWETWSCHDHFLCEKNDLM